jgi:hypothetical protein
MGRIIFVTVGTTAAENEELVAGSTALRRRVGESKVREWLYENKEQVSVLEKALLDAHQGFWTRNENYRINASNFRQTSAESISTYSALQSNSIGNGRLLTRGEDKVVLLQSNTLIGQMCGRINSELFQQHLFTGSGEDVVMETINDLHPGEEDADKARDASKFPIYPQIRDIVRRHLDDNLKEAVFNITGSFKGVIPAMTFLATTRYPHRSSRIIYLHESMEATVILELESRSGELGEIRRSTRHVNE